MHVTVQRQLCSSILRPHRHSDYSVTLWGCIIYTIHIERKENDLWLNGASVLNDHFVKHTDIVLCMHVCVCRPDREPLLISESVFVHFQ